ncbi:HigA family addiction module antitoxin [Tateyamaria sp. syn59]|uniref:HigA family addiction module antitoxin n=1 Tax=Tateyamaria sp. syn59 TaxID=2576942 RepID=UPI0011BD69BB|nr:HigA family addiction module antitoxin [Tateyamaria sp. syn59]
MASETGALAFKPPHPGEYLREDILPALDMNAATFAKHLGVHRQSISKLLNEQAGISTDMAVRLGKALQNGARFWLSLQMQYDLWEREQQEPPKVQPIDWNNGAVA